MGRSSRKPPAHGEAAWWLAQPEGGLRPVLGGSRLHGPGGSQGLAGVGTGKGVELTFTDHPRGLALRPTATLRSEGRGGVCTGLCLLQIHGAGRAPTAVGPSGLEPAGLGGREPGESPGLARAEAP